MYYLSITYRNCYFYYFVFFFKQKTAYEMRISDWSSDVCSSDLQLVPEFIELGFDWRQLDELWDKLAEEIAELQQATGEGPARIEDEQIGRASCRERVCQYV